jgi:glycosyltransferase involved in cell wall biosynthesis
VKTEELLILKIDDMTHAPLVSVIVTTYYRNKKLRRAIESVTDQSYEPIELIVVDDSGENYASDVVSEYEAQYIGKEENEGQVAAWNDGFMRSSGELINFLDDDDKFHYDKISKQVRKYHMTESGVIHAGLQWESSGTVSAKAGLCGNVLKQILSLNTSPCVTSTMLIERGAIEAIFPIPEYPAATDDALKIELARQIKFDFIDEPLIVRGVSDDNVDISKKVDVWWDLLEDYTDLYEQYPDTVRKKAMSHIYYNQGKQYHDDTIYSIKSILNLSRALYYSPGIERRIIFHLVRSLIGNRIFKIMKKVFK